MQTNLFRFFVETLPKPIFLLAICLLVSVFSTPAGADVFVYPAKGQTPEQQKQDEYACHQWAVQQTGFDPTKAQTAAAPPPAGKDHKPLKGAAGGALLGLGIGSLSGNAGKGAAIGAAVGGVAGAASQSKKTQQQQAAQQQEQEWLNSQMNRYNQARRACLEGRGYSVK
jgi:hypothetical protein